MSSSGQSVDQDPAAMVLQMLGSALKTEDFQKIEFSNSLHKDVAGSLVACASLGEMMRHELAHGSNIDKMEHLLGSLDSAMRQALQVVRELSEGLFPPVLKAFGLHTALQQLVRGITEDFTGSLVLHINGEETRLDLATRLNLFNIIKALLTCCVSHEQTSWIEVTCRAAADKMEITIDHNGGGEVWTHNGTDGEMALVQARCLLPGTQMEISSSGPAGVSRVFLVAVAPPSSAEF